MTIFLLVVAAILFLLSILGFVIKSKRLWISSGIGIALVVLIFVMLTTVNTEKGISRALPSGEVSINK